MTISTTRPVLLFDGDCGFCTASITWLRRHRLLGVSAEPWQSWDPDRLPVPEERLTEEVVLAGAGVEGGVLGGADALATAVRLSPSPLRFVGGLALLPPVRPLARAVYRRVARNRYRLGGGGSCTVG